MFFCNWLCNNKNTIDQTLTLFIISGLCKTGLTSGHSLCFIFCGYAGYKCVTIQLARTNSKLEGGLMEKTNEPNFHLHNAETVLDVAISSLASLKSVYLCVSLIFILPSNFFPCIIHTQFLYLYPSEQEKWWTWLIIETHSLLMIYFQFMSLPFVILIQLTLYPSCMAFKCLDFIERFNTVI